MAVCSWSWFQGLLHDGFRDTQLECTPPASARRPRTGPAPPCAGLARQGGDVAVPGHRSDVLHRVDRDRTSCFEPAARTTATAISIRPTHSLAGHENTHGILLKSAGESHDAVEHILHAKAGLSEEEAKKLVEAGASRSKALISGLKPEKAKSLLAELKAAGADVEDEELQNAQVARCPTTS